ncbi:MULTISPECIES: septum site-determining protein MinC [Prochlorococcus]|uniref:septum site-determining protein MinC n=1 Tax=Prochlorococcus TaxID=1218 RepID=UPI0005339324|nr:MULTISPECIES: septum site-determining protein MinC [Prochlorococcus]KGG13031.1 Septum site-determining protein MinC [Prochlorococcus sp. MIT 0601]
MYLSSENNNNWKNYIASKIQEFSKCYLEIKLNDLALKCNDIVYINSLCERYSITILSIDASFPETVVSAKSLGFKSSLMLERDQVPSNRQFNAFIADEKEPNTVFHEGTLRSGENIDSDGDLLILGDINPGAVISAGGDVMVWGRLLGIAHAGKYGNDRAKITALQLRPVQLRISNKIARGPKEKPEQGLAEEAIIEDGVIVIKPSRT